MTDLIARLIHAITTASNDDMSEPGTDKRRRHVERIETMQAAIDELVAVQDRSDAIPHPEIPGWLTMYSIDKASRAARLAAAMERFSAARGDEAKLAALFAEAESVVIATGDSSWSAEGVETIETLAFYDAIHAMLGPQTLPGTTFIRD